MTKVLAIDQSYTRMGVAIVEDGVIIHADSHKFKKGKPARKRKTVREGTDRIIRQHGIEVVLVERVRIFAGSFISTKTMFMLAGLTSSIIDVAYENNLPTYSIDTRSWKAKILGNHKASKHDAVRFILDNHGISLDHDAADAACIGLYYFNGSAKLTEEY